MGESGGFDRRALLFAGAGLAVAAAGCDAHPHDRQLRRSNRRPTSEGPPGVSSGLPTTTPAERSRLPAATTWQPSPADVLPDVKAQAARVIETLGSWQPGSEGATAAQRRLEVLGQPGSLTRQAGWLLGPYRAAVTRVLEAQYGGILESTASVLVVCRQWRLSADGALSAVGTTVDVRLEAAEPHWRITSLHPAEPGQRRRPSPMARRVLGSDRIDMPRAARSDVASGRVHSSVLTALVRLSQTYEMGISVIRSGHPAFVFGTTRRSDHWRGRAFDTYRIDADPSSTRAPHLRWSPATCRLLWQRVRTTSADRTCLLPVALGSFPTRPTPTMCTPVLPSEPCLIPTHHLL